MTSRLPEEGGWIANAPSTKCARSPCRSGGGGPSLRLHPVLLLAVLMVSACAATQAPDAVAHDASTPGFLLGLWHGFIFPIAWIVSLFTDQVAVYAVPNTGGWYDFGFFLGVCVLGGGSHFSSKKRARGD